VSEDLVTLQINLRYEAGKRGGHGPKTGRDVIEEEEGEEEEKEEEERGGRRGRRRRRRRRRR
jgi:hypothetical protein